jgi:AcrR family transcriptional regulator
MKSRPYAMTRRAEAARDTGERILAAAQARFTSMYFDDVTLDVIAADAGVTVQTVIRRFGSKDRLVRELTLLLEPRVAAQRDAPVGDVEAFVGALVAHYEDLGDLMLLLLRQEEHVPSYAAVTARGRLLHAGWVSTAFAPWIEARKGAARRRLRAQLVAVGDVYMWHLLRRQQGLSQRQTASALTELLNGLLSCESSPIPRPPAGTSSPPSPS